MVPQILKILSGPPAPRPPPIPAAQIITEERRSGAFGIRPQNGVKCGVSEDRHQLFFWSKNVEINGNRVTGGQTDVM